MSEVTKETQVTEETLETQTTQVTEETHAAKEVEVVDLAADTEVAKETETENTDAVNEAEAVENTEEVKETETTEEPEAVKEAVAAEYAQAVEGTEVVEEKEVTKENNETQEKSLNEKLGVGAKTMLGLEIALGVVLFVYLSGSVYFENHFYIGSRVNGVEASFKNAKAAYEQILTNADDYKITFVDAKGNEVNQVSAEDLGFEVNYPVKQVQSLLDSQTGFNWVARIFVPAQYYTKTGNTYDKVKVKEISSSLDFSRRESTMESENACIYFDGESFVIEEEVYGDTIDSRGVEKAITNAVENLQTEINIEDGSCFLEPSVKADDNDINRAVEILNKYMETDITYDLGDGIIEEVPAETKADWFTWDEYFNVSINKDAIAEFVDEMAEKYDTYGEPKRFVTTDGKTINVPSSSYGWKINRDGEVKQIMKDLKNGEDVVRDFTYSNRAKSHGVNDYGNSYVEVNLSTQHVYVYRDGLMVLDTNCVSGNIAKGTGTHTGVYSIAYKQKDATLRGDNYESHVSYWMPFNMGEGLHDATWRSKFGGDIYRNSGSHGCVNLPLAKAGEIYNIVEQGWPVIVFYTGNTEKENAKITTPQAEVMTLIADIESVTLESEAKIVVARQKYDALTDEQKAQVTNYEDLVSAETVLNTLKEQAAAQAAAAAAAQGQVIDPATQQPVDPAAQPVDPAAQPAQPVDPAAQPAPVDNTPVDQQAF